MSSPRCTSGILSELGKQVASLESLQLALSKKFSKDERGNITASFWKNILATGTPLCKEDKNGDFTVTFFYRSDENISVELDCNDLNEQKVDKNGEVRRFQRIPDTDIYYFQVEGVPRDAIIPYGFYVSGQDGKKDGIQDSMCKEKFHLPLCNLDTGETIFDQRDASLLVMPDAKRMAYDERPSWCRDKRPGITAKGEIQDFIFDATADGFGERKVWIYTPPEFDKNRENEYKLMVMTDGGTYAMLMPPHLDARSNAHPEINNVVVAFVGNVREGSAPYHPVDLTDDIGKDDTHHRQHEFIDHSEEFYSNVIAPIVDKLRTDPELSLNLSKDPQDTILAGFSLGGHFAAEVGLNHSDNIGNVVCLSGAFNTSIKSLTKDLSDNHDHEKDLNIFISVGQLESLRQTSENQQKFHVTGETRVEANQNLAESLLSKGYNVQFAPLLPSGHNELSTMHALTDMALPFVCAPRANIELRESAQKVADEKSTPTYTNKL